MKSQGSVDGVLNISISKFPIAVKRKPGYLESVNKLKSFTLGYHLSHYCPDGSFLKVIT